MFPLPLPSSGVREIFGEKCPFHTAQQPAAVLPAEHPRKRAAKAVVTAPLAWDLVADGNSVPSRESDMQAYADLRVGRRSQPRF